MDGYTFVKSWPDNFRYSNDDVVLRFSSHPTGVLLLHTQVLNAQSKMFKAMFSSQWGKASTTAHGSRKIKCFEVDLVLDCEDGFTYLQANVRIPPSMLLQRANIV
jgi:hypothetical protein